MFLQSCAQGAYHSLRNMFVLCYLDREMNKKQKAKNERLLSPEFTSKKPNKGKTNEWVKKLGLSKHISRLFCSRKTNSVGARVFQCSLLNGGIFLLSILFFDYALIPALKMLMVLLLGDSPTWGWIQMTLSWIFSTFWILPLFLLSKIINTFFWQDIADQIFEFRKGKPSLIPSISKLLADVIFSLLVQTLFLLQTMALNFIPYVGTYLKFCSFCILYSLYSCKYAVIL